MVGATSSMSWQRRNRYGEKTTSGHVGYESPDVRPTSQVCPLAAGAIDQAITGADFTPLFFLSYGHLDLSVG